MGIEVDWTIPVNEVTELGSKREWRASATQCAELAAELGILSCEALIARSDVRRLRPGRYRVTGQIDARVTQACVVTLDPVESEMAISIDAEFWPLDEIPASEPAASPANSNADDAAPILDIVQADRPEAIVNGRIGLGRLIFEEVSAALDPYPRKKGVAFDWKDPRDTGATLHPFDALRDLKPKT